MRMKFNVFFTVLGIAYYYIKHITLYYDSRKYANTNAKGHT